MDGVYGRTGAYESVVEALAALISCHRPHGAEVFRFPPVMPRASLEKQGYLQSFPNLIGAVSTLTGTDREITRSANKYQEGGDWTEDLKPADLVLAPAACYPIYPIAAERGVVPDEGYVFDVAADCFRREPSRQADRFQSFRMREYVRIGTPEQIQEFREPWIERAKSIADAMGLPYTVDVANDPFFGRVGTMMATQQRADALKFELLVPVRSKDIAHRLHELQLSQGTFRRGLGPAQRQGRGAAYRLRRVRHGPAGGGAVRDPWRQDQRLAGQRAQSPGALKTSRLK